MSMAKKYRDEIKSHNITKNKLKATEDKLRIANNQHKDDLDIIGSMTTEIFELSRINKNLVSRYDKECYHATINNGNVINLVKLDAYREYIRMQEIDPRIKYINTAYYQNNESVQFVTETNGIIEINETKYKLFLGGIL
jgi:hypothetical protein